MLVSVGFFWQMINASLERMREQLKYLCIWLSRDISIKAIVVSLSKAGWLALMEDFWHMIPHPGMQEEQSSLGLLWMAFVAHPCKSSSHAHRLIALNFSLSLPAQHLEPGRCCISGNLLIGAGVYSPIKPCGRSYEGMRRPVQPVRPVSEFRVIRLLKQWLCASSQMVVEAVLRQTWYWFGLRKWPAR